MGSPRRGKREFFGYEGFTGVLRDVAQKEIASLDEIASRVVARAKVYAGGTLKDDVCLLLARRDQS